jgi:hypothetical protein
LNPIYWNWKKCLYITVDVSIVQCNDIIAKWFLNMSKPPKIPIIFSIALIIAFFIMLLRQCGVGDYISKIHKEFEEIQKKDSIFGKIIYIEPDHPKLKRGGEVLIILDTNQKIWLHQSYHYYMHPSELHEFIRLNDFIVKKKNNDTLYIVRDTIYYFVLGKSIVQDNE